MKSFRALRRSNPSNFALMVAADLVLCHTSAGHPEELRQVPAPDVQDLGSLPETARLCRTDVREDGARRRRSAPGRPRSPPPRTSCRGAWISSSEGACTRCLCTPGWRCWAWERLRSPHLSPPRVQLGALPGAHRRPLRPRRHRAARGAAGKTRACRTRLWERKGDAGRLPVWPLSPRGIALRCTG